MAVGKTSMMAMLEQATKRAQELDMYGASDTKVYIGGRQAGKSTMQKLDKAMRGSDPSHTLPDGLLDLVAPTNTNTGTW